MFEDRVSRATAWAARRVRVTDKRFAAERAESLGDISDRRFGLVAHSKSACGRGPPYLVTPKASVRPIQVCRFGTSKLRQD
jgi:hypothetical protein